MTTATRNADDLARALGGRRSGSGWIARCPAHDDKDPSLSISEGADGTVLLHCHARCSQEAVIDALKARGLWEENNGGILARRIVATYPYLDEAGKLLYEVVRFEPKDFRFRRPDGRGGWIWKRDGVRLVPYRLPDLLQAKAVFVCEGEKDCESLAKLGLVATTNPMGAGKWPHEFAQCFPQKRVAIIPDNDKSGREHAIEVAENLVPVAQSLRIVELPVGKDVTEFIERGGTKQTLIALAKQAEQLDSRRLQAVRERWLPAERPQVIEREPVPGEVEMLAATWPDPPTSDAYYGLAGEFVRAVEPHSEADPVAILVQFLVAFANLIGRSAHFMAEADKHFLNLFAVLIGATAKGRKGTSWGHVRHTVGAVDNEWSADRIMSGLSSGEGLIWQARDPLYESKPAKESRHVVGSHPVLVDEGVSDKRLLVIEPEFARVLQVCERDTNTLSAILRQAWDSGELRILTKKQAATVTAGHISLIGHITRDELRRLLTDTATVNGFANRFLWLCVRRSKMLPEGGALQEADLAPITRQLQMAADHARTMGEMRRDDAARDIWRDVYPNLSEGHPGMLGAVISRAEAQVMRLACVYALLDRSAMIRAEHLLAALALWRYSEASAQYIFGDTLGNPVADELLRALRNSGTTGMSRTEIRDLFGRHQSGEVRAALRMLSELGMIAATREETGGRPTERWFCTSVGCAKSD